MSFSSDPSLQVNQLPLTVDLPKDPERMHESLVSWLKRISNSVNSKEGALYTLQELYSFKQFYTVNNPNVFRNVYRYVFDAVAQNGGNIAGGATVTFNHGISGITETAMIYADCTSAASEFFSVMGYSSIRLTATQVIFTNPLPATALTKVSIVAEYLKS